MTSSRKIPLQKLSSPLSTLGDNRQDSENIPKSFQPRLRTLQEDVGVQINLRGKETDAGSTDDFSRAFNRTSQEPRPRSSSIRMLTG